MDWILPEGTNEFYRDLRKHARQYGFPTVTGFARAKGISRYWASKRFKALLLCGFIEEHPEIKGAYKFVKGME